MQMHKGTICFFLPKYGHACKVYLYKTTCSICLLTFYSVCEIDITKVQYQVAYKALSACKMLVLTGIVVIFIDRLRVSYIFIYIMTRDGMS